MKMKTIFALACLTLLVLLSAGCAAIPADEGLIFGASYRLGEGETLDHDLAVFGGSVMLDEGSIVEGSLAVFGGSVVVDGTINGDLAAFGGVVSLEDSAVIDGDVFTYGASVSTNESAVVKGTIGSGRSPSRLPSALRPSVGDFDGWMGFIGSVFWRLFQALALAALAVLAALFVLRPLERVGDAITTKPVVAGTMGALTLIAGGSVLVAIVITIILIPVTLFGLLLLGTGLVFGWIALGLITGEKLAQLLHQEWSGPVSAGLGTLLISLGANLIGIIPCVGWLIVATAGFIGLGGVVLTRFGRQSYPPPVLEGLVPPAPPVPAPSGVEVV